MREGRWRIGPQGQSEVGTRTITDRARGQNPREDDRQHKNPEEEGRYKNYKATDGKKNRTEQKKRYREEELPAHTAHSETEMNII